jgi:wobble nucleotide-excising tRNase
MADNYTNVLLDDMNGKFDILLDGMKSMHDEMKTLAKQTDLEVVKQDVKAIKLVLTDTNKQVQDHEHRVSRLEAKV